MLYAQLPNEFTQPGDSPRPVRYAGRYLDAADRFDVDAHPASLPFHRSCSSISVKPAWGGPPRAESDAANLWRAIRLGVRYSSGVPWCFSREIARLMSSSPSSALK